MTRFEDEEKLETLKNSLPEFEAWVTKNLNG